MGENGRLVAGLGALLMAIVSISGALLLVARMGGLRRIWDRPKGPADGRLHTVLTRIALLPFLVSALTGCYIVLTEFELVPVVAAQSLAYPASADLVGAAVPIGDLAGLNLPIASLRRLQFPYPDDPTDVFTLTTDQGLVVVDQFSGAVLETVPATLSEQIYGWFYALHTGEGMAWLGAVLGLAAALTPLIAGAGVMIWWRRRRLPGHSKSRANSPAHMAEIIVLTASEGGTTWGFAHAVQAALVAQGRTVHLAPLSAWRPDYEKARHVVILAATYGNGQAPDQASGVLRAMAAQSALPSASYAVLGFGDRAFPQYCQFAKDLDALMQDRGWPRLMQPTFINRQSSQAFASWGQSLAAALGQEFVLHHEGAAPKTRQLRLIDKTLFGTETQTPTAILRFRDVAADDRPALLRVVAALTGTRRYTATDLLGVVPISSTDSVSSTVPRFYSVASARSDDEVEICVRKQVGGLCSTHLCDLEPGATIDAFARANPGFALPPGRRAVIMVAAGTGIAPFVGLIRENHRQRPLHLFWGGRTPDTDYLYRDLLQGWRAKGRLASLVTAFSRVADRSYVQDRVATEAARLGDLVRQGAGIMVCGGDAMALAVRGEFAAILTPLGISIDDLRRSGRYVEDIF